MAAFTLGGIEPVGQSKDEEESEKSGRDCHCVHSETLSGVITRLVRSLYLVKCTGIPRVQPRRTVPVPGQTRPVTRQVFCTG